MGTLCQAPGELVSKGKIRDYLWPLHYLRIPLYHTNLFALGVPWTAFRLAFTVYRPGAITGTFLSRLLDRRAGFPAGGKPHRSRRVAIEQDHKGRLLHAYPAQAIVDYLSLLLLPHLYSVWWDDLVSHVSPRYLWHRCLSGRNPDLGLSLDGTRSEAPGGGPLGPAFSWEKETRDPYGDGGYDHLSVSPISCEEVVVHGPLVGLSWLLLSVIQLPLLHPSQYHATAEFGQHR